MQRLPPPAERNRPAWRGERGKVGKCAPEGPGFARDGALMGGHLHGRHNTGGDFRASADSVKTGFQKKLTEQTFSAASLVSSLRCRDHPRITTPSGARMHMAHQHPPIRRAGTARTWQKSFICSRPGNHNFVVDAVFKQTINDAHGDAAPILAEAKDFPDRTTSSAFSPCGRVLTPHADMSTASPDLKAGIMRLQHQSVRNEIGLTDGGRRLQGVAGSS